MRAKAAFVAVAFAFFVASSSTAQVVPDYNPSPSFPGLGSTLIIPQGMPDTGPQWQSATTPIYSGVPMSTEGPIETNPGADLPTYREMNPNTDPVMEMNPIEAAP